MAEEPVTKSDLLQLKLDIQKMFSEGFDRLREEMEEEEEKTDHVRHACEGRFRNIETYIAAKQAVNGSRDVMLKKQWDKKLPMIAFLSAVAVVFLDKLISLFWR